MVSFWYLLLRAVNSLSAVNASIDTKRKEREIIYKKRLRYVDIFKIVGDCFRFYAFSVIVTPKKETGSYGKKKKEKE